MALINQKNIAYSLNQPLSNVFPEPIASQRAPQSGDKAPIGTVWVDIPNNQSYILTSLANNTATWTRSTSTPTEVTAAGLAATLNGAVGVVTLTGNTTAAGAQETFTITNSSVTAASGILLTVANVGGNDARMTLEQVKPAAGSFEVFTQNNGAAALNGDVIISFIVLS